MLPLVLALALTAPLEGGLEREGLSLRERAVGEGPAVGRPHNVNASTEHLLMLAGHCAFEQFRFKARGEAVLPVMCCTSCPSTMLLDASVWVEDCAVCGKCITPETCRLRGGKEFSKHTACALPSVVISI